MHVLQWSAETNPLLLYTETLFRRCSQVVVLSEGSVVEAGHPHLLLESPAESANSAAPSAKGITSAAAEKASLSSMVEETGPASAEHLRRLARDAWEASKGNGKSGTAV